MKRVFPSLVLFLSISSAVGGELPSELKRLNEQRESKIAEINRIYIQQLELLKIKYTKAGDLDAANQVVAIIRELDTVDEPNEEMRWEWGSGGELVLRLKGVATHTVWDRNGKWRREEDGSIRLESDTGKAFTLRVEGNVGHVISLNDGKRTVIKRKE